jgi:hypothetical protein
MVAEVSFNGFLGALLVAIPNWYFLKRWIDSVDARFDKQDQKIDAMGQKAESAKRRVDLERVHQFKGCLDMDTHPSVDPEDRDSTPPIRATGRHAVGQPS